MDYGTTLSGLVVRWAVHDGGGKQVCIALWKRRRPCQAFCNAHTHSPTYNISQAQGHHIDTEDWHAFVHHTLPYEEYLRPDPALRRMLSDIPYPMCVGRERRSGV